MLPLVDKPAIQYVVEEAVAAGITDILIITGRGKRSIEDHFDRSFELEAMLENTGKTTSVSEMRRIADMANFHYVRQGEPKGLGHAVWMAKQHVGDEPFAVLLGDDVMHETSTVLQSMLDAHQRLGQSVIALKRVPQEDISAYGCADVDIAQDNLVRLKGVVEKPAPVDAPSNLAIMGRYVLTADVFDAIERTPAGKGGEIQLTDALELMIAEHEVWGWAFDKGRFDIGKKIDFLKATVELALEREDLGDEFRKFLEEITGRVEH